MHIISKAELVRTVAERWQKAYCYGDKWTKMYPLGSSQEIHEQLLALGSQATDQQVSTILPHGSWTANICSECGRDVDVTVHFGEEPDYDPVWVDVCPDCLRKGIALLEALLKDAQKGGNDQ